MKHALAIAWACALPYPLLAGDGDALRQRHARIEALYKAGDHAQLITAIDVQLLEAQGTTWVDSLHYYLYKHARAHRMLKGAEAGAQAGERILRLVQARGVPKHELKALMDLSWYYYDIGRLIDCARVDSMGVALTDKHQVFSAEDRGKARQYLAFDHSVMGDHGTAARWARDALDEYERGGVTSPVLLAEATTALGVSLMHMGRYQEAEERFKGSLAILGEADDPDLINRRASVHGNLGVLWQHAGDLPRSLVHYQASIPCYDRVIAGAELGYLRDEAVLNRSRTYLNQATVYFELGDLGRAQRLLELAWKDRSSVLEPGDAQLLSVKDRMADVALAKGDLEQAVELVSAYLKACGERFGMHGEPYIRAASKLGDLYRRMGDHQRADSLFRTSLSVGGFGADAAMDQVLHLTLLRRAQLHSAMGRHAQALEDLRKARTVMVNIHGPGHFKVAQADILLAEAHYLAGEHQQAIEHARNARAILDDRVRALRANALPVNFPEPELLPEAIYWEVLAERAQAPGEPPSEHWNGSLDLAIASLARNRTALQDEASKLLLVAAQKRLFGLAIDLAQEAHAASGSQEEVDRFLAISEADRSVLLKGKLNAFAGLRFAGVPDSVLARERELIAALEVRADDRGTAMDRADKEEAYRKFLATLERTHPAYFALRHGEPRISISDIRERLLTKDRDLVVYAVTGEYLHVLVLGLHMAELLRLPISDLAGQVRALNEAIATRDAAAYVEHAHTLYEVVFAPVAERTTAPELLIIPDGPLHLLNFEALLTAPSKAADFKANLLIRRHAIAYLLSASTALRFADLKQGRAKGTLALAPGFTDDVKQDYLARVKDTTLIDRHFLRYVRQPFAVHTAQDLGGLLSARVMVGGEATEQRFREQAARHGILHLGTHAEMNTTSPMYSRLVLSKDGLGMEPDADGYLHAYEIYALDLRAQLAVLTACETGTGQHDAGEGVRSIGYGFAFAGCPSLVMSLWKIDEKVSSEIITRFYANLAKGLPKHIALRQAKLDHLDHAVDEMTLPYYWAGLVLVGDVEPVDLGGRWSWTTILAVAALVLMLLLFLRRFKR
ncbi:MAG: CHAT domain-containing protein [Flavobacteriales bacterium]|nr:CHAT domain-containing protein [Flavobacteriales bacterium]